MQNFFRNIEDIELKDGDSVDAGSLWQKVEDIMILVDDDRYVEVPYNEEDFTEISDSNNTNDD